jgi:hypothetical protein
LGPHSLFEDRFIRIGAVPGGYVVSIAEDTARNIWIVNRQRGLIRFRSGPSRKAWRTKR